MLTRTLPLLCLLCASLSGQNQPFFLQGADPQFGMHAKDDNFTQETANFEFFISTANRLKPAFVVICGDLTNTPGRADEIAEYHRIAGKIDPQIPFYSVAGNHDVKNEPTLESLALYRKNYGPDWYSFEAPGLYGIVLNSSVIKYPAHVPEDAAKQEAWLKAELVKAQASNRIVAVFQHIPWFLASPEEPDDYFNITLSDRGRYLKLLTDSGVRYVFAGHYHRNALGSANGLSVITTGPIGMPIGPDPSGFRAVTIGKTGLTQEYIGLGNIPNHYPPPPPAK